MAKKLMFLNAAANGKIRFEAMKFNTLLIKQSNYLYYKPRNFWEFLLQDIFVTCYFHVLHLLTYFLQKLGKLISTKALIAAQLSIAHY